MNTRLPLMSAYFSMPESTKVMGWLVTASQPRMEATFFDASIASFLNFLAYMREPFCRNPATVVGSGMTSSFPLPSFSADRVRVWLSLT